MNPPPHAPQPCLASIRASCPYLSWTRRRWRRLRRGGAAINVLARELGARVVVADIGVDAELPSHAELRQVKVRRGTSSITRGAAMTVAEATQAIDVGRRLVLDERPEVVLTGDMGIGNTTASAAGICALTGAGPEALVGRGAGVYDAGVVGKGAEGGRGLGGRCASSSGAAP